MDKVLSKIIRDAAEKNGIDQKTAEQIYTDVFKFVRGKIEAIDFDTVNEEDDLRRIKTNFNIPRIFKLYTIPGRIYYARERIRKIDSTDGKGFMPCDETEQTEDLNVDNSRTDGVERHSASS